MEDDVEMIDADEDTSKPSADNVQVAEHTNFDTPAQGGDRVLREIDVLLKPKVEGGSQLYLVQYPLRPFWRPYGLEERCQEVRVKTQQAKLEVDLVVDTESENYDDQADEHLVIKKQTLTSSHLPLQSNYAVGILHGKELHINPLHAVVQLRPSLAHLDAADTLKKEKAKSLLEEEEEPEVNEQEEKPDLIALQVQVRRRETERQEESRLHSHAHLKAMDEAEPWVPLKPYAKSSAESATMRQKLQAAATHTIPFSEPRASYIASLVPSNVSATPPSMLPADGTSGAGLSRSFLETLPLERRLHMLLSKGKTQVLHFEKLMKLVPADCSEESALEILQQKAMLVQGCWVAASSLRYTGPMQVIRDYVLLLFTKNRVVKREDLEELRVPKEMLREVLLSIGMQKGAAGQGWEFQESTDKAFIRKHPEVVKLQMQRWAEAEDGIRVAAQSINIGNMQELALASAPPAPPETTSPSAPAPRSAFNAPPQTHPPNANGDAKQSIANGTSHSEPAEGLEVSSIPPDLRPFIPGVVKEMLGKHGVCRLPYLAKCLREVGGAKGGSAAVQKARAAAKAAGEAPQAELAQAMVSVANHINGAYFLKSTGDSSVDAFREVVIALLRTKSSVRKSDIQSAAKLALRTEVPTTIYQKVVKELCMSKGGVWVLKSGNGPG